MRRLCTAVGLLLRRWRRRRYGVVRTLALVVLTAAVVLWWTQAKHRNASMLIAEEKAERERERVAVVREEQAADRVIQEAEGRWVVGAGENGAAVTLAPGPQRDRAQLMISTEAFNLVVSDMIGYNRSIPDNRHPNCLEVNYDSLLPNASVIIIFTNEAWSALLRTIHSVINRTPPHLLHEIILFDDYSDRLVLKKPLERYIELHFPRKVLLLRASRRLGLIRARLEGAKAATGQTLVFLDSHCECNAGWLEPLMQRIKEDRRVAAVPIIEVIDDKTLQYMGGSPSFFQVGSFTWSGHFTWINIPEGELKRRQSVVSPTRSATMAGGLFAMDRKYFWEIGSYDEGMEIWGGENLELSFRVWMCGGSLETIPCSRVGHIFRSFHPYTFPGDKDTHGINTVRMAEVWMDDYKRLFYLYRPDLKKVDYGDISSRKQLRRKLGCKSFNWFLENVAPDKFILDDDSLAYGRVMSLSSSSSKLCFDTLQQDERSVYTLGVYPCHSTLAMSQVKNGINNICLDHLQQNEENQFPLGLYMCHDVIGESQFFALSLMHQLRREDVCAEVSSDEYAVEVVHMKPCVNDEMNQEWIFNHRKQLKHKTSGRCLDSFNATAMDSVRVKPCRDVLSQTWTFDKYNVAGRRPSNYR